jgi:hypothetical protein
MSFAPSALDRSARLFNREELFMNAAKRAPLLAVALAFASACGGRQVEVRTAPTTATASTEQTVQVTNNLSQAVNVYVTATGGTELFLRQVPANTVERVPVQGIATGTTVVLKAVTVDGSRTYMSKNVPLRGMYPWAIP